MLFRSDSDHCPDLNQALPVHGQALFYLIFSKYAGRNVNFRLSNLYPPLGRGQLDTGPCPVSEEMAAYTYIAFVCSAKFDLYSFEYQWICGLSFGGMICRL